MAIPSFYHPTLHEHDSYVSLDQSEATHAVKARRLKVGQEVRLFDGHGLVAHGTLSEVGRRSATVDVLTVKRVPRVEHGLTIAVPPPKGDRQKVMLDMLTQLGVSGIVPLSCDYSVSKFSDTTQEKWRRVTIEAAKQSQNAFLPTIHDCVSIVELIEGTSKTVLVANADGQSILNQPLVSSERLILVGPEGGFSQAEFNFFKSMNISSIALGGHILRTEAAAVAAAAQFNLMR